MSETTNFGQASLVVRGVGGPSINVTSIRVSNTILSFDSSTGSITANVYDTNGSLIRLSRIPIQIQSTTQPASAGPGDEWVCTSNTTVFKYTTASGWGALGGYTVVAPATPVIYTNFPATTESYIKAVTSDAGGNVYATGYYTGTMTIKNLDGSSTAYAMPNSSTSQTTMLIKWNSVGVYVGAMAIPVISVPYSYNSGFSLACDAGSNVYVSGKYYNALVSTTLYNLTANPNSSSSGQSFDGSGGPFLIKYNATGTYVSGTLLKPDINELSYGFTGVACDAGSNVYFTGSLRTGSTIWNLTANPNSSTTGYSFPNNGGVGGISNPFLLKFNSAGTYTGGTIHVNGNANYSFAGGVACDAGSNVYMTGTTVGVSSFSICSLSLNPNSAPSIYSMSSNAGQYLIKYNAIGDYASGTQLTGSIYGGTGGEFVTCDAGSNVYAGYGAGNGTASIYNLSANPIGSYSGYTVATTSPAFLKWNPSGTYVGGASLGSGSGSGTRLVCDASSNVYYAGAGNSTIYNLALNTVGSSSGYTITGSGACLYKYSPSGSYLSATSIQSATAQAVCIASSNVYYAGYYTGNPSLYNLTQSPNTDASVSSLPSVAVNTGYMVKYGVGGAPAPAPVQFSQIATSPGVAQVSCCTTDSSRNIYIGGFYTSTGSGVAIKTFAANPNVSTGYSLPEPSSGGYGWGFVLKYDSSGNYVYGAVFPSTSTPANNYCYVWRLACDSSGNLYVALTYRSSGGVALYNMALNPAGSSSGYSLPQPTADSNPALIKYNSSGVYQYSTVVQQGSGGDYHGVACDSSGNVYWTTGIPSNASQTIYNLSANPNTSSSGYSIANQNAYLNLLIKYNSSGTYQSSTYVAVSAGAYDVILDSVGNIYWSFNYSGQSTMYNLTANPNTSSSGYSLINANGGYAWVALIKYNSSGTYQYSTVLNLSTSYSGGGWFCARDSSDNIYWAGPIYTPSSTTTVYNMTANPNTSSSGYSFPSSNLGRGVVIKYNSSGTYQSSTSLSSSPAATYIYGVACDSSGTVYVVGQYATTATIYNITLNPNTISSGYSLPTTPSSYYGPFLASWNSSGTYLNSTSVAGATGYGVGKAVCCDSVNSVYYTGWEQSTSTIYSLTQNPNSTSSGYNLANGGGFAIKYYPI